MEKIYQAFDGQYLDLSHVLGVTNSMRTDCGTFYFEVKLMFNQQMELCWYPNTSEVYDSVRGADTTGWNENTAREIWDAYYAKKMVEFEVKRNHFIEDWKKFKVYERSKK